MSMGILDIIAKSAGQLNADGERITKWIDLAPEWKFLMILLSIGVPFIIFLSSEFQWVLLNIIWIPVSIYACWKYIKKQGS
jgi:hypothetical protein